MEFSIWLDHLVGGWTGDGYCRSETVGTVFLQKSPDAKRVYATVVHSGNNADGYTEQGEETCIELGVTLKSHQGER